MDSQLSPVPFFAGFLCFKNTEATATKAQIHVCLANQAEKRCTRTSQENNVSFGPVEVQSFYRYDVPSIDRNT